MLTDKELSKYVTPQEDVIFHECINRYQRASVVDVDDIKELPPVTPMAEQKAILDKITAEIWEEAEWAYSDFDDYKEVVLEAEPDELPDDEFRFGLHRAVEIINKYKAESEE